MENNIIFAYLCSGAEIFKNKRQFIGLFFCLNIFTFIGIIYGFLYNSSITNHLAVTMLIMFGITVIILLCIPSKNRNIKSISLMKAIAFSGVYIQIFLLIGVVCSISYLNKIWYITIFPSIFIMVLYSIFLAYALKTDKYSFLSDKKPKVIRLYSLLGGIAGIFIAKTFLDKDSQNTAVTVLLICLTLYLCFIGISVVTFFVKAYLILRMSGDTLILYATYLLKCAKEKSSFESSQYIEQAASIIKNSNLSGQTKDELLCEIESSDDV